MLRHCELSCCSTSEGILLHTLPDGLEQVHLDSAPEGLLMLDILRHEKPIYIEDGMLYSGFEDVGMEHTT